MTAAVRLEGIRKVYHQHRRDIVAVEELDRLAPAPVVDLPDLAAPRRHPVDGLAPGERHAQPGPVSGRHDLHHPRVLHGAHHPVAREVEQAVRTVADRAAEGQVDLGAGHVAAALEHREADPGDVHRHRPSGKVSRTW